MPNAESTTHTENCECDEDQEGIYRITHDEDGWHYNKIAENVEELNDDG